MADDFVVRVEVPYPSERLAGIAARSVAVDKELRPEKISRSITHSGNVLAVFAQ